MSIATHLPRLGLFDWPRRPARKHRAPDEVARQKVLRSGAELLIKGLRLQLADMEAEHAEVIARIEERHAAIVRELEDRLADFERRLQIRNWADNTVTETQELDVRRIREEAATWPVPAWAKSAEGVA